MQSTRLLLLLIPVVLSAACSTTGVSEPVATPLPYKLAPSTRATYRQAVSMVRAGKYKQAEKKLKLILKSSPRLAGPYANLAIIYHRQNRLEKAQTMIATAIKNNPGNPEYHNLGGIISRQQGKFGDAREFYIKAIALRPGKPEYHLNLGILYDLYLHEHGKALAEYKKYQQLRKKKDKKVAGWIVDLGRRLQ